MKKDYISTQKYLILSPRKVREVVYMVRKLSPVKALEKLMFIRKRSAEYLAKVIKTVMAQARLNGESDENLVFKEIQVGEGPRLKRGRAASRGRWHPYKKRMSHIRVVITTKDDQKQLVKSESEKKEVKAVKEVLPELKVKASKKEVIKKKVVKKVGKKSNGTKS